MEHLYYFLFHNITSSSFFFLIINNLLHSLTLRNVAPVKNSTTFFCGTRWNIGTLLRNITPQAIANAIGLPRRHNYRCVQAHTYFQHHLNNAYTTLTRATSKTTNITKFQNLFARQAHRRCLIHLIKLSSFVILCIEWRERDGPEILMPLTLSEHVTATH